MNTARATFLHALLLLLLALPPVRLAAQDSFSVATYNVRNWVTTDRVVNGRHVRSAPKPEEEKRAVVAILKRMNPDILLVQEMGTAEDFADFRRCLEEAGLRYTDHDRIHGTDKRISQAVLSRFPIRSRQHRTADVFEVRGQPEGVQRGFIDVDITVSPKIDLRVMGVHLKSRRGENTSGTPSLLRRREALLLRGYISDYLNEKPDGYLLVGGDFNDTFGSESMKTVLGGRGSPFRLYDLWLRDWTGDRWTHDYEYEREYSQIDFLIVSQALFRHFISDPACSYVYRARPEDSADLHHGKASDHRAVMATFSFKPQPPPSRKAKNREEDAAQ